MKKRKNWFSMRRKRKMRENMEDINITPIMDVVFLILIYFFVTGSSNIKNQIYKVRLPVINKNAVDKNKTKYKSVTFISYDEILIQNVNNEVIKVKFDELGKYLDSNDEILLSIDKSTKYENVIELMNKLKSIGVEKINLNSIIKWG